MQRQLFTEDPDDLTNKKFTFGGQHYLQIRGKAIMTLCPMVPYYANLNCVYLKIYMQSTTFKGIGRGCRYSRNVLRE